MGFAVRRGLHHERANHLRVGDVRDEEGQAFVEFALVAVPLILLLLGMIDFGIIFTNVIGMRQGVSDAARQAAVGQFGSSASCTLAGSGTFTTADKELMCLVRSLDGLNDDSTTRVGIIVGDTSSTSYANGGAITVCEEYALNSTTGLLSAAFSGHVVTTVVTQRVETLNSTTPLGSGSSAIQEETALPGSSWSFCNVPAPTT
jgi:Flp pilus assembly protein TadG